MVVRHSATATEIDRLQEEVNAKARWVEEQLRGFRPYSDENHPENEAAASDRRSYLAHLLYDLHEFSVEFNARAQACGVGAKGRTKLREPLTKWRAPLEKESGHLSRYLRRRGRALTHYEHVLRVARRAVREKLEISEEELRAIRAMSEKFSWKPV